jgi:hypothetical protein
MPYLKYFFIVLIVGIAAFYLSKPSPQFPPPPPESLQSDEPADTESVYRRAYYTNYSRSEILTFYDNQFRGSLFQFRLNYPPEEAFALIRDQTPSSWLEEIVHPGRESLFVNGFYPTKPTQQININGTHYLNKITIQIYPSRSISRLTVLLLTIVGFTWLKKEYAKI